MNQLEYGDNLQVLREHIEKELVDLIYLDPLFNSKHDYNLLSMGGTDYGRLRTGNVRSLSVAGAGIARAPKAVVRPSPRTVEEADQLGRSIEDGMEILTRYQVSYRRLSSVISRRSSGQVLSEDSVRKPPHGYEGFRQP